MGAPEQRNILEHQSTRVMAHQSSGAPPDRLKPTAFQSVSQDMQHQTRVSEHLESSIHSTIYRKCNEWGWSRKVWGIDFIAEKLIFVPWKQLLKDLWRTYSFMDVRLTESTPLYVCLGTLGSTENAQEVLNLWCSNSLRLKPTAAISCCYFGWECVTLACSRNWLHQMETSSLCSDNCLCSEIEVELIAVDFSLPTDQPQAQDFGKSDRQNIFSNNHTNETRKSQAKLWGGNLVLNTHSTNRPQVLVFVLSNLILCFIFQSIFCLQCTKQPICPIQNKMQNYLQNPEMKPRAREKNDAALPNRGLALNRQHLTANDK